LAGPVEALAVGTGSRLAAIVAVYLTVGSVVVGGLLVDILFGLVISFYLLLDGPIMRRRVLALIPSTHGPRHCSLRTTPGGC
jgi:predicted PurR-regulated permease PerM